MTTETWSWAELDEAKLELVDEAEESLPADYVLVYEPGARGIPAHEVPGVAPAPLDAEAVQRLQAIEQRLGKVAVAYTRS